MRRPEHKLILPLAVQFFLILAMLSCARPPVPGPQPSEFPVLEEPSAAEEYVDLNTVLMRSTFKLQGTTEGDSLIFGTAFVFDLPCGGDPERAVLITSVHLLDSLVTDQALLGLRDQKWDGTWEERPWWIRIRDRGQPLWMRHRDPEVDVAAMCIELPQYAEIPLNSIELLADAETFGKYEIHPGDELLCLGYSSVDGVHGPGGFPILRGGVIASYPLEPVEKFKTFKYDVEIFKGYSGGPVYLSQLGRLYGGASHPGEQLQCIVGLLSKQWFADQEEESPLKVAEVVHAHFIREIVEELLDTGE